MEAKKTTLSDNLPLIVLGIFLILVFGFFTRGEKIVIEQSNQNTETISVTGESSKFVAPDTATVNFSLTQKTKTVGDATNSVNVRVANLLLALEKLKVSQSDIKTTSYSVNPEYTYNPESGVQQFNGYRVSQAVDIKIKDLTNVEAVLGLINEAKVDYVSGLTFSVDDDQSIRETVREEAITQAKSKAKALEKQLGVKLDTIVGFYEDANNRFPQPYFYADTVSLKSESAVPSIPTGENEIQTMVTITYKISDKK